MTWRELCMILTVGIVAGLLACWIGYHDWSSRPDCEPEKRPVNLYVIIQRAR